MTNEMSDEESDAKAYREEIVWGSEAESCNKGRPPDAQYSKISERMRHLISESAQCFMFCGGRNCKYENSKWPPESMAINGLFSNWITENILAMNRPNREIMKKYDIINQLKQNKVCSIINLQKPGEHSKCGPPLHSSGFSYDPQEFMDNNIFFYTFGWPDYGVASLQTILDMAKVLHFAISDGKVAVHCHAGLGRTGVMIACYLIFANRMSANEAIHFVRLKRRGSIQTRNQILCVQQFAVYLQPLRVVFSTLNGTGIMRDFTLQEFLIRQKHILHGEERRRLRYLPKIIYVISTRLLRLVGSQDVNPLSTLGLFSSLSTSISSAVFPKLSEIQTASPQCMQSAESQDKSRLRNAASEMNLDEDNNEPSITGADGSITGRPILSTRYSKSMSDVRRSVLMRRSVEFSASKWSSPADSGSDACPAESSRSTPTENMAILEAMCAFEFSTNVHGRAQQYADELNTSSDAWDKLWLEEDPHVLCALLYMWLEQLKEPVLSSQDLQIISQRSNSVEELLRMIEQGTARTLAQLVTVATRLHSCSFSATSRAATLSTSQSDVSIFSRIQHRLLTALVRQNVPVPTSAGNETDSSLDSVSMQSSVAGSGDSGTQSATQRRSLKRVTARRLNQFYMDLAELISRAGAKTSTRCR